MCTRFRVHSSWYSLCTLSDTGRMQVRNVDAITHADAPDKSVTIARSTGNKTHDATLSLSTATTTTKWKCFVSISYGECAQNGTQNSTQTRDTNTTSSVVASRLQRCSAPLADYPWPPERVVPNMCNEWRRPPHRTKVQHPSASANYTQLRRSMREGAHVCRVVGRTCVLRCAFTANWQHTQKLAHTISVTSRRLRRKLVRLFSRLIRLVRCCACLAQF